MPEIFMSEETPMIPAEAIGIETLCCLKDIENNMFE
jgi:hypothetical protein